MPLKSYYNKLRWVKTVRISVPLITLRSLIIPIGCIVCNWLWRWILQRYYIFSLQIMWPSMHYLCDNSNYMFHLLKKFLFPK